MEHHEPCGLEFLLLRDALEQLDRLSEGERKIRINLPEVRQARPASNAIEAGSMLTATLKAVAKASARLRKSGISALGQEPLAISLSGELAGVTEGCGEIFVRVRPENRGKGDGGKKEG